MSEDIADPLNRTYCPALDLVPLDSAAQRYERAVNHFRTFPWCEELLNGANTYSFLPNCRNSAATGHRDQFMGKTLATDDTLPHVLCFFQAENPRNASVPIDTVQTLFAPEEGLGGVGSMLHGGFIMTMMDEAANVLLEINTALGKEGSMFQAGSVTGTMDVKFRRPVLAGEPVMVTSQIEDVATKGRKLRIKCVVKNEDGDQLAQATSTWFVVSSKI